MKKNDSALNKYKSMIFKFKQNLTEQKAQGKLFPYIGDREIDVSQRHADNIRSNPTVPDFVKDQVTRIHHGFVKFVWMM